MSNMQPLPPPGTMTLGATIDRMYELREAKRLLNEQVKKLTEEYDDLEAQVLARLDADETTLGRGKKASAGVSELVVPTYEDWDAVLDYIRDNDAFYLFPRNISSAAYRELLASGEEIPGTKPYTKRSISLKKV